MVLLWLPLQVVLFALGLAGYTVLYAVTHPGRVARTFATDWQLAGALAMTGLLSALLLPLHEAVHGLVMRRFGAQPRYGYLRRLGPLPGALVCTAPGHWFRRWEYLAVALAPTTAISVAGALLVAFAPGGGWLVVPLALHLSGCVGDLWVGGLTLRQPAGTMVEDVPSGARFRRPA